jgi:NitT/TauT family transport system substrate-binding protein
MHPVQYAWEGHARERRRILGMVAFVAASLSLIGPSRANETLRVGKAVPQAFSFALLDVGIRQGLFRVEGLDIEISAFGGGARLQQALAADAVDVGLDTGPDMAFIAKGAPVKAVGVMAGPPLDTGIAVGAKTSILDTADLKGRRIAGPPYTLTGWLTKEFARRQGWGFDGITLVDTGSPTTSWAMVKTGELDGLSVDLGSALQAQAHGEARLIVRFGDWIKEFHNYVIFATAKRVAERPNDVRAFLRGWFKTIAFVRSNKAATVAVVADALKMDPDLVGQVYDLQLPMYSTDGHFDPKALAVLSRSYVEMGNLQTEPDMKQLYTEAYLPEK